jgi:hypothetical protein
MSISAWRGGDSEKIENIEWKRPGVFQVRISKVYLSGAEQESPNISKLFDSGSAVLKLVTKEIQNKGVFSKCILTYQGVLFIANEDEQWSANVVLDQENIAMHPNIEAILKAGGGSLYQNKVSWPRMILKQEEKEGGARFSETGGDKKKPVKNPFYGTTSYFIPRIEVTREKFYNSTGSINAAILSSIGLIDKSAESWMGDSILSAATTKKTQDGKVLTTVWMSGADIKKEIYT